MGSRVTDCDAVLHLEPCRWRLTVGGVQFFGFDLPSCDGVDDALLSLVSAGRRADGVAFYSSHMAGMVVSRFAYAAAGTATHGLLTRVRYGLSRG